MAEFPTITHVALTVSDLTRSVPWYEALFGSKPVLDEDTGPFRHVVWLVGGTLVGLHQFPDLASAEPFDSAVSGWITLRLRAPVAASSRSGSLV